MSNQNEDAEKKAREDIAVKNTITHIVGIVYELFEKNLPLDRRFFHLNTQKIALAIRDASTDLVRVGDYISDTGTDRYKKAAYISWWIASHNPIQLSPQALDSSLLDPKVSISLNLVNEGFAVFVIEAILGDQRLTPKLHRDLRYSFTFRKDKLSKDALYMLLEHSQKL
jgi:hypothetical protein